MNGPVDSFVYVGVIKDNTGVFSSELQCHVLQVRVRCRPHHFSPDDLASSESNLHIIPVVSPVVVKNIFSTIEERTVPFQLPYVQ